jgi:hypothetical protein
MCRDETVDRAFADLAVEKMGAVRRAVGPTAIPSRLKKIMRLQQVTHACFGFA